jgi:hypothetical protein
MFRTTRTLYLSFTAAVALAVLTAPAHSQAVYLLDTVGGAGAPLVVHHTGGPGPGPCAYPNGPYLHPAFAATAGACPGPAGPVTTGYPGLEGDIAVNQVTDRIWVAGHAEVGEYEPGGAQFGGFTNPLPGPIKGLGCDSAAGRLWITDGIEYGRVVPVCGGAPAFDIGPFPSPLTVTMTDIAWDPATATVWAAFADGTISNMVPGAPPTCVFDAKLVGLGAPLTGLDVDTTTPGFASPAQVIMATDGLQIARIDVTSACSGAGVALAPPTFAFPNALFPVAGGPVSGLAFSAQGTSFGGGSGPDIGYAGHSHVGSTHNIHLFGALPGQAGLFLDFGALCPAPLFKGLPLHVAPLAVIGPIPHTGTVLSVPATIPATAPIGVELFLQWFNKVGPGVWQSTPGMVITTSLL